MTRDRRLGKGLAALLGQTSEDADAAGGPLEQDGPATIAFDSTTVNAPRSSAVPRRSAGRPAIAIDAAAADDAGLRLPVDLIDANPFQPRREFNTAELASMAESLKTHDMLQPVLVRKAGARYQLISGERRLRAAIEAGWTSVPVRVREADDRLAAELAIVENLQRKDLNAIEKALSFRRYLDEHRCLQEDLAKRLGIDRSTIANLVRLLELPEAIQSAIAAGDLSAGHARALLPLGEEREQLAFSRRIQDEGLSVRETERLVQERVREADGETSENEPHSENSSHRPRPSKSEQIAALEQELRAALGCRVDIRQTSKGRGRITVQFASHEDFDRIREHLLAAVRDLKAA